MGDGVFLAKVETTSTGERSGMIDGSYLIRLANKLRTTPSRRNARTEADRLLARRICRMVDPGLEQAGITGLQFYVRDGSVTVFGPVTDESRRDHVVALLRKVPGIHAVISQMQLIDPEVLQPISQRRRFSSQA